MAEKWKKIVGTVAPTIAAGLFGPFAGLATKALAEGLGLSSDATETEIEKAVLAADPSQLATLRQIDADFKVEMKKLDIDLEQIFAQDRDSARRRQQSTEDPMNGWLSALVTIGFFGELIALMFLEIPDASKPALLIMLGVLGTEFSRIMAFYFGSSKGSQDKTQLLSGALK